MAEQRPRGNNRKGPGDRSRRKPAQGRDSRKGGSRAKGGPPKRDSKPRKSKPGRAGGGTRGSDTRRGGNQGDKPGTRPGETRPGHERGGRPGGNRTGEQGERRRGRPSHKRAGGAEDRRPEHAHRPEPTPPTPQDEWIDEGRIDGGAKASSASSQRSRRRSGGPHVSVPSFAPAVTQVRAKRLEQRFTEAARAFAADRFSEARAVLKAIEKEAPGVPEVQELYGLTLYRLGKWSEAAKHLREFVNLTGGSVEQHPVLADCERALGHHDTVDRLWGELREASPSAELVTEGRIVTAGSLADRGRLSDAIALLSKGFRFPRKVSEHHLRRAYALADLYERSGDLPQARQLFGRLEAASPGFVDVEDRLASLG